MSKTISKTYDPQEFEQRIYDEWEQSGSFKADDDHSKKPFAIVMPPPNITGKLHMGHALDQTLQDVLIRWRRMQGYNALWIPGSDHASIATEVKVVNKVKEEEGKTKEELGREEFLKRVWDWKEEYGSTITKQIRKLGASCDWSRERFTMDEGCSRAVVKQFVNLHKKGLIYRGNRLINWCPNCGTSLSDAEVEHSDKNAKYYYIRYPGADGSEGIVVATSRPETMFGDCAVAVRSDDERYKDMIGKKVIVPVVNREVEIIGDPYPDPEKGTGAVKITPAHDPNDFAVGERHDLPKWSCLNDDATMNSLAGKYEGMDRYECRKALIKDIDEAGYLVKTEDKVIPVGECYRCHSAVEPMISDQWFVKMKELAQPAVDAVKNGDIKLVPERFSKIYMHWLEDIHDWCISRQLWWGHRIPAYYCEDCGEIIVSETVPDKCPKCGSTRIHQDEDVLDTWFSSALWPFSTLGWPDKNEDLDYFYPTDVLVTGYDIIFFWVIRMVFSGIETMGEIPFKYVYVHGLVRDAQGRKMSKSLGNGIDPLDIIEKYGADALRFMLMNGITPGNDMRFIQGKLEGARNFANKLWNASRFVLMNITDEDGNLLPEVCESVDLSSLDLKDEDKWIISTVNSALSEITGNMEKFELALASQKIYDLIWNNFCDWYIEFVKSRLYGDDAEDKRTARLVLVAELKDLLRLLHPFMPYITEEIWSALPRTEGEATEKNPDGFLIRQAWPEYSDAKSFPAEEAEIETVMEAVRTIRNIRSEADTAPSRKVAAVILAEGDAADRLRAGERHIRTQAGVREISFIEKREELTGDVMSGVINGAEIFINTDELMDYEAEHERLLKEKKKLEGEVARVDKKLANQGFVSKAPEKVIQAERDKQVKYTEMLAKVTDRLAVVEEKIK
ncbi:MAG: valine--tRNA ligase [Anaerovoracaceae bacterium]|nr:valine--tRNA ligase [Bacillota bacterium]MDY2671031.1 valine--tRNA ligase [Anaerovoracaceae bacterium]